MDMRPLIDRIVCLSALSKDLKGELRGIESERQECRPRDCITLETVHQLDVEVFAHDCDSRAGRLLDGRLSCGQLVHKFEEGDGNRRGVHEGPFRWRGAGVLASGTMTGVTNMGTHRQPAFDVMPALRRPRRDGGHAPRPHPAHQGQPTARLRPARHLPPALRSVGKRRRRRGAGHARGGDRLRLRRPSAPDLHRFRLDAGGRRS